MGVGAGQQEPHLISVPSRPDIWWVVHEFGRDRVEVGGRGRGRWREK